MKLGSYPRGGRWEMEERKISLLQWRSVSIDTAGWDRELQRKTKRAQSARINMLSFRQHPHENDSRKKKR